MIESLNAAKAAAALDG